MSLLKFIGTGSAFNSSLGHNSAYIKFNNRFILFDCGGSVFLELEKLNIMNDVKHMYVFITHNHPDHVGSLGDLVYFCYYMLHIKPNIYSFNNDIEKILNLQGVSSELFVLNLIIQDGDHLIFQDLNFGKLFVSAYETKHYDTLRSQGYLIKIPNTKIYYSGDCSEIPPYVLNYLKNGKIDEFYQDTCGIDYDNNPHMYIGKLKKIVPGIYKNRVYCMHLDNEIMKDKYLIKQAGFNIAKNSHKSLLKKLLESIFV